MQQISVGVIKSYLLMIRRAFSKMVIEGDEAFVEAFQEFEVRKKITKQ